VPFTGRFHSN